MTSKFLNTILLITISITCIASKPREEDVPEGEVPSKDDFYMRPRVQPEEPKEGWPLWWPPDLVPHPHPPWNPPPGEEGYNDGKGKELV